MIYPDNSTVRLVDGGGNIKWRNNPFFLSTNLIGQYVALSESENDLIAVTYGKLELGEIDPQVNRFIPRLKWNG